MMHQITALLLALVLVKGRTQDFRDRWITRPPVEYEFPHVIYIDIPEKEEFCSGSLIHESWVLTAASCMYQGTQSLIKNVEDSLVVYAGVKDRTQLNDTHVQMRRSVKVRFPDEKNNFTYYSPALIKVNQPFVLNRKLGVEIVSVSRYGFHGHTRHLCKAGSYGTLNWENKNETLLKKLDIRLFYCNCTEEIQAAFSECSVDEWLCGQTKDFVGICRGDFGMGMVCDGELRAVSIGLIRFKTTQSCEIEEKHSTDCRLATNVGLFVDICYYVQWLSEFVCNIQPPTKSCKALAWHPTASLRFVWIVAISHFLFLLD